MNKEQVLGKLKEIVVDKLGCTEDEVVLEASFVDDLGADSLYLNEIVYEIEEQFNIRIPDSDFEMLRTVGKAVEYISEKVGE